MDWYYFMVSDIVELIDIARMVGLPAPGMILSDERCREMVEHCRNVLLVRSKKLKIFLPDGEKDSGLSWEPPKGTVVPILLKGSYLNWRPALRVVSVFPIDEEYTFEDLEFGLIDIKRPLFYCEIRGDALKELCERKPVLFFLFS